MISSKDILAILITKLRKELKDTHIECRDVKEGYRRGSIHIYFENLKASDPSIERIIHVKVIIIIPNKEQYFKVVKIISLA